MRTSKPLQNHFKTIAILSILLLGSLVGCERCSNGNPDPVAQNEDTQSTSTSSIITQAMIDAARDGGPDFLFLLNKLTALKQAGNNTGIDDVDKTANTLNKDDSGKSINLTALHYAVLLNNPDIIRALCTLGASTEAREDKYGATPLFWGAWNNRLNAVQALLQQPGIDVNAKDNDGMTPLMEAAERNLVSMVQLLLQQAGIDVNAKDKGGMTALMNAAKKGHLDVVQELLQQAGIDVNAKDKGGMTALMYAAKKGHLDVVQELLKQPAIVANINEKDSNGKTALGYATKPAIKKALTDKRAL